MTGSLSSFVRAFFVSAVVVGPIGAEVACSRPETHTETIAAKPVPSGPIDESAANDASLAAVVDASGTSDASSATIAAAFEPAYAAYATSAPLAGKSIGHTSVVFKLKLEGGLSAAYKPQSKRGNGRYRGEIAAYRLGRALGIPNVPPAIARTFAMSALRASIASEPTFDEIAPSPDGTVPGAIIPWIKGLEFLALEKDPWWERWHGWLAKGGAIPDDQIGMAKQISTMIVFDYVTGNWDRWSGGNVGLDAAKKTILFIDNDGAFFDPPPAPALAKQLGILEKTDRYSRSFVAALRIIDLKNSINVGPLDPLLTSRVLAQVDERRKKALAIIDSKIQTAGESETLRFE